MTYRPSTISLVKLGGGSVGTTVGVCGTDVCDVVTGVCTGTDIVVGTRVGVCVAMETEGAGDCAAKLARGFVTLRVEAVKFTVSSGGGGAGREVATEAGGDIVVVGGDTDCVGVDNIRIVDCEAKAVLVAVTVDGEVGTDGVDLNRRIPLDVGEGNGGTGGSDSPSITSERACDCDGACDCGCDCGGGGGGGEVERNTVADGAGRVGALLAGGT